MKTSLHPSCNGVNVLDVRGVTLLTLDEVDSWLFSIGVSSKDRATACRQILAEGSYSVCNIEYRVEMRFRT